MREELKRKSRTLSINNLRNRVWWASIGLLSGRESPHWIWNNIVKRRTSRSRWYTYSSGCTNPRDDAIQYVAEELPETELIFNALFWSALKGETFSEREVVDEFKRLNPLFTCNHPLLEIDFWGQKIAEDPGAFEMELFRTVYESDPNGITLQAMILIMALAKKRGNIALCNLMCDYYRAILPLYISSITLPYKDEIFDEVDKYFVKLDLQGIKAFPIEEHLWRQEIPKVKLLVKEHYTDYLYLHMREERMDLNKLPEGFIPELATRLASEFCLTESTMLYCWSLWEPISFELVKLINAVPFSDNAQISVEYVMNVFASLGYFEEISKNYMTHDNLMRLANERKSALDELDQ